MSQPSFKDKLNGVIEADETYVGGTQKGKRGRQINKAKRPVFSIVKRGGDVRSFHVERVTAENLVGIIQKNVKQSAYLSTDEFASYGGLGARFAGHVTVKHSAGEFKRGYAHTNTLEGYFSLLKRGLNGTYHHVNENHLHRYLSEFDFRYNNRKTKRCRTHYACIEWSRGEKIATTGLKQVYFPIGKDQLELFSKKRKRLTKK